MKKFLGIVVSVMLCMGLLMGCGKTDSKEAGSTAGSSALAGQEENTEEKELTGTIEDIKDFMFDITDASGACYSFTFDKKPEGLENVSNGDNVTVKYTGTISEVDPFEGEVILVEKADVQ